VTFDMLTLTGGMGGCVANLGSPEVLPKHGLQPREVGLGLEENRMIDHSRVASWITRTRPSR